MTLLLDAGTRSPAGHDLRMRHNRPAPRKWAAGERSRTLDDLLSGAWEGLTTVAFATSCPVCQGELEPRWSAGSGVVGGRCRDCGSELS